MCDEDDVGVGSHGGGGGDGEGRCCGIDSATQGSTGRECSSDDDDDRGDSCGDKGTGRGGYGGDGVSVVPVGGGEGKCYVEFLPFSFPSSLPPSLPSSGVEAAEEGQRCVPEKTINHLRSYF